MSMVVALPSRCALSHCTICGGTKPITPILIVCFAPASSMTSRSSTSHGFCRVSPLALMTLAQTSGNFAVPMRVLQEVEAVIEFVVAERAAIVVERRSWRRPWGARRPSSCRGDRRRNRPAASPGSGRRCRTAGCSWPRPGRAFTRVAVRARPDRVVGRVAIIVVREDVHVEVGGLQDAELDDRTGGPGEARHCRRGRRRPRRSEGRGGE